jgi:ribonuclease HI
MASEITIYTDGACSGNPGPGGFGVVLISGRHRLEKAEGYKLTTNNRMELMAVITGLEALKIPGSKVVIYTDSKYVADSIDKGWVFKWELKEFKKKKNADLWKKFLDIYRKHYVSLVWIKGHANNPENERCDHLAVGASQRKDLKDDIGYITESGNNIIFRDVD